MLLRDATRFIGNAPIDVSHPQVWADLGCGDGLFTRTLATLLGNSSLIYAIDKTRQKMPDSPNPSVEIRFEQADFEQDTLDLPPLDGILMANSLHYIKDKAALMSRIIKKMTEDAQFLIIEYDTMLANPYVPYPIDWATLRALFEEVGFVHITRLGEKPSIFGRVNLYAASAKRYKL
jgi:ubiquinone/menaquinone biosynthesis C-methylase UbiE